MELAPLVERHVGLFFFHCFIRIGQRRARRRARGWLGRARVVPVPSGLPPLGAVLPLIVLRSTLRLGPSAKMPPPIWSDWVAVTGPTCQSKLPRCVPTS